MSTSLYFSVIRSFLYFQSFVYYFIFGPLLIFFPSSQKESIIYYTYKVYFSCTSELLRFPTFFVFIIFFLLQLAVVPTCLILSFVSLLHFLRLPFLPAKIRFSFTSSLQTQLSLLFSQHYEATATRGPL